MELFDYAPILIKADKLINELGEECLHRKYEGLEGKCDEVIVQMRMLRAWLNQQKGEA